MGIPPRSEDKDGNAPRVELSTSSVSQLSSSISNGPCKSLSSISFSGLWPKTAPPGAPAHYRLWLQTSSPGLWPLPEAPHGLWPLPGSTYKTSTTSTKTMSSPSECRSARRLTHALPYVLPRSRPLAPRPSPPRKRLRHESLVGVRGLRGLHVFLLVHGFDDAGIMCLALLVLSS